MLTLPITEPAPGTSTVSELVRASGLPLEQLRDVLRPLVDLHLSFDGNGVSLHPGTSIGTMTVRAIHGADGLRIDVKPRLQGTELTTLIRYAYGSDFASKARSEIAPDRSGLAELLCRVLADELTMIRQRGVSRLYVNRKEPLTALRGRPDFIASFPWNDRGMTSLTCRYHELSCDTLDNQLILAALDHAVLLEIHHQTRTMLMAHRHVWHELTTVRSVTPADFRSARNKYTRLTEHYRLAHHIAELIASSERPQSFYEANQFATAGVSLDMAEMFELAVSRLLRETLEPLGYTMRCQSTDTNALRDGEGQRYRSVRPDVVISRDAVPVAVVDMKYKDYWQTDPNTLAPVQRVSNEDLYQLFFYASRLQASHHRPSPPPAIIISPAPSGPEASGQAEIADRFRMIRFHAGSGPTNALSLVLFPLSQIVDELAANQFLTARCSGARQIASSLVRRFDMDAGV